MITSRMAGLLRLAATDLRKGIPPLEHNFLANNEVTLDEAYDLAEWMAVGCDALLELDESADGRRLIGLAIGHAMFADGRMVLGDND